MGHYWSPDTATATDRVHEVELIGLSQMRSYYPDLQVWVERLGGLPKSLVAIRR